MGEKREAWLVVGKYCLFQLPGIALIGSLAWWAHRDWSLPGGWAVAVVAAWTLKDIVLFPFVRHAYAISGGPDTTPQPGTAVIAREEIAPEGYVKLGSELWRAELRPGSPPLAAGESGRVCSVHGLTLVIEAD